MEINVIEKFNVPALQKRGLWPSEINCLHPQGSRPDETGCQTLLSPLLTPAILLRLHELRRLPPSVTAILIPVPLYLLPGQHLRT